MCIHQFIKTMKKEIIKSLLAMACLLSSTSVLAYDFEVDGIYYDVVSFTELTCKVVKESSNKYYEGDVVIPATVDYANKTLTVVGIADETFRNCSITAITIPNTISSIGNYMFNNCSKLARVTIEDGNTVLELGYNNSTYSRGLFYDCPIESLYLSRNLSYGTDVNNGYSPFAQNKSIKEITIGDSVTSIGSYAFYSCSGLTSVTIPNSVTEIGSYAFSYCSGLTSVAIPNSVTEIGSHAFYSCSGLTSVTIPNSVISIGANAFWGCSGLTSVTIPNSVTSIGSYAFSYCRGLTSMTIPNSVTEIGNGAFRDCSGLTSVTIPNSVTSIGSSVFYNCRGLTSVTIPNSVTSIGSYAFSGCSGLTSVTIPNSVTSIGSDAFSYCSALTTLYSLNTTPPSVGSDNFTNNQYMTLNVFVPQEALEAYQNAEPWNNFWNLQGFDATGVENVKAEGGNANTYYDLRGNRLDAPKRGLNIINGKKVMMKQ